MLARMAWGTFCIHLPWGVKSCQDGLEHFFLDLRFQTAGSVSPISCRILNT